LVTPGYRADWSPDGTRLCFTDRSQQSSRTVRIGVVNIDGSDRRLLTPPAAQAFYPTWSPDGEYLAFSLNGDICRYVFSSEDTEVLVLAEDRSLWVEDISLDSRFVAYHEESCVGPGADKAYVLDLASRERIDVGQFPLNDELLGELNSLLASTPESPGYARLRGGMAGLLKELSALKSR
jgi:dipeptidyl aminopeptidase/acylaminoacyl peptidase